MYLLGVYAENIFIEHCKIGKHASFGYAKFIFLKLRISIVCSVAFHCLFNRDLSLDTQPFDFIVQRSSCNLPAKYRAKD